MPLYIKKLICFYENIYSQPPMITFSQSISLSKASSLLVKASKPKVNVPKKSKGVYLAQYDLSIPEMVSMISNLSLTIRKKMRFHGVESHYQAALEAELQELGLLVQHEVAEQIHYKKLNGESVQLPHDIRCREDLLLPREKLILELKAKGKMDDKDHCQLLRYMEERNKCYPDWGGDTKGMLINFGDTNVEVWYMCYKDKRLQRVKILEEALPGLDSFIESYIAM